MIGLVAVAVAVGAWFKPAPKAEVPAAKTYTEQETADAKKAVCDAFDRVQLTLQSTSDQTPPDPNDPMQKFTLAVNGRLAAYAGGDYLLRQAATNPAAPSNLLSAIADLASAYQDSTLSQLANADRAKLDRIYRSADVAASSVRNVCR